VGKSQVIFLRDGDPPPSVTVTANGLVPCRSSAADEQLQSALPRLSSRRSRSLGTWLGHRLAARPTSLPLTRDLRLPAHRRSARPKGLDRAPGSSCALESRNQEGSWL